MSSRLNERKRDHLRILTEDPESDRRKFYFDQIKLKHRALPEIDRSNVDTQTEFMGKTLSFPLLISCMTGGVGEDLRKINRNLAIAAETTGVAMGLGSQRVMLADGAARHSFMVRPFAPHALLFGNLGAVQLNNGIRPDDCRTLVEETGVDALCLHLNPLQEAVQPEGDTDFSNLADRIAEIVEALAVPVIVKEVGAGIGPEDAERLITAGVRFIDVAGAGGTSWSRIESHRDHTGCSSGVLFQDWGLPTPDALRLLHPYRTQATLIASGGIRSGIDMVKSLILGASLCGIARPFIDRAAESPESVIAFIASLKDQFTTAMFLLGVENVSDLIDNPALLL
ncbi:MAG: type 2 isopentenyl-diphosphate Delta-isomerase [Verrucomicrobia bacterium]|jgi:isopentenyl-diphosphate Delta-isomerase|nr:type 2 isopentenyl-diphosphate Delta-isomerase [Verrucomicrobiota bacterium]